MTGYQTTTITIKQSGPLGINISTPRNNNGPVIIVRVGPDSLASKYCLQVGDHIYFDDTDEQSSEVYNRFMSINTSCPLMFEVRRWSKIPDSIQARVDSYIPSSKNRK